MGISSLTPEIIVAITHFAWTFGWWVIGHLLYLAYANCDEKGMMGCASNDLVGFIFAFGSSIVYFYIARHVLNFLYKKELPGGEDLSKYIGTLIDSKTKKKKK